MQPLLNRDQSFVRELPQGFLECRAMRHAYRVEYFGTLNDAPDWVQAKWNPATLVMIRRCIRCQLATLYFMNNANGGRALSGEPFRPFATRSVYPKSYLWHGDKTTLDRPATPDYNRELYNRWRTTNE